MKGIRSALPGVLLCVIVTLAGWELQLLEQRLFGKVWFESLVLAILVGTAVRTVWAMNQRWNAGINFSAKTLLEIAVVLLGASLSAGTLFAIGPLLLAAIAIVVIVAIAISYGIGRVIGLPRRMAMLVACGNSICGNSAIAAAAPVIGASSEDVAASVAFTAVLGIVVVVSLPLLRPILGLDKFQYGVLAGLTVYAVPQVLAATAPLGSVSIQIGTLVKLVRVLMLGPVMLALSLATAKWREESEESSPHGSAGDRPARGRIAVHHLMPWFVVGFLALAGLRSAGLIPVPLLQPVAWVANLLTIVAMAALGLGVELRSVAQSGSRVTAAVTVSLLFLGAISFALIRLLNIG
jgi:uncharacterized integral membrane protein (TIGR00698 family)